MRFYLRMSEKSSTFAADFALVCTCAYLTRVGKHEQYKEYKIKNK